MNEGNVRKWCRLFEEGRTTVHDQEGIVRVGSSSEKFFEHPPCGPELTSNDYDLFLHPKKFLAGQSFRCDQETEDVVQDWLRGLAATFSIEGTQKLVPRCGKCLNLHGDYVEKWINVGTNMPQ
jgi:hypothetical protein